MDYLYHAELTDVGDHIIPQSDLRRHLAALRIRDAQIVMLFNGKGLRASCTLMGLPSDGVLRVDTREHAIAPSPLTLAVGLIDSRDRLEFAIEKATELGATEIVLLESDHSAHLRATALRLQAKIVSACEQSGRSWLPELIGPITVDAFLAMSTAGALIIGDQLGDEPHAIQQPHVAVMVGPEGGFSQREQTLLRADPRMERWAIGAQRLRAETAGIAMLAVVSVCNTPHV